MYTFESLMKDPDEKRIFFTVDDYTEYNIKMATILKSYNIPAIFFIELLPQKQRGTITDAKEQIQELYEMGFGIGGHSYSHPMDMKKLTDIDLDWEILQSKEIIEEIINETVFDFAYPRGRFNNHVKAFVIGSGYTHARTTRLNEDFYEDNNFELSSTAHIFDGRKEYGNNTWESLAIDSWNDGKSVHIFCHSWEINRDNQWQRMLRFFENIGY